MRRVYLAMPSYSDHEVEMMQAAYRRAVPEEEDGNYVVRAAPRKGQSLLACGFNQGLVDCLNSIVRGDQQFDYWCLLHGDVEPSDGFIHTMIEELEAHGLNAIHAAVAIKDNRGITSTAIGPISRKWTMSRKITTTELRQLPDTFTINECLQFLDWGGELRPKSRQRQIVEALRKKYFAYGDALPPEFLVRDMDDVKTLLACIDLPPEPQPYSKEHAYSELIKKHKDDDPVDLCLLPNTGCLLWKIDDWCWEFPGFEIQDRLTETQPDGTELEPRRITADIRQYSSAKGSHDDHFELSDTRGPRMCQNVPEDWGFGRWAARKGLRIGCTTKVTTRHWGKYVFTSANAWGGEATDHWFLGCKQKVPRER